VRKIVDTIVPSSNTYAGAGIIKFSEGNGTNDDTSDIDGYFALYTQKSKALNWGANVTFLDVDGMGMRFWNVGLDGTLNFGKVSLLADVEYQFGDYATDLEQSSFAAMLKATANMDSFKIGALAAYGSGDDDMNDDKNEQFISYLTDTIYQVTIPGYRLAVPGQRNMVEAFMMGYDNASAQRNTGLSNLFLMQLFASTDIKCPLSNKDVSLEGRLSWLKLNEEFMGEDDLGIEISAFATWKLANGLSYKVETAYLLAGDAWDPAGNDPDDAYFVRHGLELTF